MVGALVGVASTGSAGYTATYRTADMFLEACDSAGVDRSFLDACCNSEDNQLGLLGPAEDKGFVAGSPRHVFFWGLVHRRRETRDHEMLLPVLGKQKLKGR